MCVCYRSQLIRKRSKAVEISWRKHKHKKNNNNLLPGQIIYQRGGISSVYSLRHRQIETTDYTVFSSKPKVGGDIRASHITAHSVYLLFDNPKMSQLIFIFLIFQILIFHLFVLFFIYLIYLSYTFIYLLFIYFYYFPPSAVRFLTLQTPYMTWLCE